MKDAFVLYRSIINGYRYLSLSSDAFRLFVFLNAEADDYGIVDANHVMYYTRTDITALYSLINAKCILSLDERNNVVYICAWETLNRKYDIRYIHPSSYLQLLATELPNMLITVPILTKKKDKDVWVRKKGKCTAKDAINRWVEVLSIEENFDDLTILQSSYLDSSAQIGSSINSSFNQQYLYCDQQTTLCSSNSDITYTQRVSDESSSPKEMGTDGNPSLTQRVSDGNVLPPQRVPYGDPSPKEMGTDGNPPLTQRVSNGEPSPTQQVSDGNSPCPQQVHKHNINEQDVIDNEKEMMATILKPWGISSKSTKGQEVIQKCNLQRLKLIIKYARDKYPDRKDIGGIIINMALDDNLVIPQASAEYKCKRCKDHGYIEIPKMIVNDYDISEAIIGQYTKIPCPNCNKKEGGD